MIQRRDKWQPIIGAMTGVTIVSCSWMTGRFTFGNYIVVTAHTRTEHLTVIQWRNKRQPTTGWYAVTCFADIGRAGMVAGFTLRY